MADDDESLDDILSNAAPAPAGGNRREAEAEQSTERPRDEHGRFAPKAEAPEPEDDAEPEAEEPEPEPEAETEHNAPVAAVIAERRKAQAANERAEKLEREMAEMRGQMTALMARPSQPAQQQPQQEPKPAPTVWDDPDGWSKHLLDPVQQQLTEMRFMTSQSAAIAEFGKDAIAAAEAALKEAVTSGQLDGGALKAQLSQSRDPVGDVVRWHQNSPAVQEKSLRDKLKAEIMAELGIDPNKPANPSPAPSNRNPTIKLPPSLSKAPAGQAAQDREESLDEILTAPRR